MLSIFRSILFVLGLSLSLVSLDPLFAQSSAAELDEQFYRVLRERGLYQLLSSSLEEKLVEDQLAPARRAYLALELSRTLTAHAEHLLGDEQSRMFVRAQEAVAQGLESGDLARWGDELRLQAAAIEVAMAQSLLEQARLLTHDERLRQQTVEQLRKAIEAVRKVERELARESRLILARFRSRPTAISPYRHRQLENQAEFLLGTLNADLAELGQHDLTAKRTPLQEAKRIAETMSRGSADDLFDWKARLLVIRCDRLRGDLAAAKTKLEQWNDEFPQELKSEVLAEDALILLADNRPDLVVEKLRSVKSQTGVLAGRLSLLYLRGLGTLWQAVVQRNQPELAKELFGQVTQAAEQTREEIGGIWSYRCLIYLQLMQQAQRYGPVYAEKIREAQGFYQAGNFAQAEQQYAAIATQAEQGGLTDLAAEMFFTAGSVLLQQQSWDLAGERFLSIVEAYPNSDRAAEGHLMWAYCLGKLYEQMPTKSRRQLYTQALEDHLQKFAGQSTEGDTHFMLGQLAERRLQVTQAVKHYLAIPSDHAKGDEATFAAIRCYEKILARLAELDQSQDAWRQEGIDYLKPRLASYPQDAAQLSTIQNTNLLGVARLILAQPRIDYATADRLLNLVSQAASNESRESETEKNLRVSANQLRVLSLAGQGKIREAEALVSRLAEAGNAQVLDLLDGLSCAAQSVDQLRAGQIGELQLKASLALQQRAQSLSAEEQQKLSVCLAQAYSATQRSQEAIEQYRKLVQGDPTNLELREELSRELMKCGTSPCLYEALDHWKYLVGSTKQGSVPWLEARAEEIDCQIQTDQTKAAQKLLQVTELLYPELGNETLQRRYEKLKEKLGNDR